MIEKCILIRCGMKKIINCKTPCIGNGFLNFLQESNQYVYFGWINSLKISVANLYFYGQQIEGIVSEWLKCCCQWAVDEVSLLIGKWLSVLKLTKIEICCHDRIWGYQQEAISNFLLFYSTHFSLYIT